MESGEENPQSAPLRGEPEAGHGGRPARAGREGVSHFRAVLGRSLILLARGVGEYFCRSDFDFSTFSGATHFALPWSREAIPER